MSSTPPEDGTSDLPAADDGGGSVASASTSQSGSGSTSTSSSGSGSRPLSDSRRVAPKWLGKKVGRFRLQGLLGQGAVGRVFRAEDAILHRRVALKVIVVHSSDGQINRNADQFLTEARAAAALEHPNVVQIYEAGETGNLCYIAMELLDGGSLKDLIVASGAMDPGRACLLAADAAEALAAAHEAGIYHRDIKPANLMLTRQGRCKVTDFGLATFGDGDSLPTDRAAGTPLFAAPEVIRGTTADAQSDIYSLGATLFYLLTGRPPFNGKSRSEVLRRHVNDPVPDLRQIRPGLPESVVAAVEKSLDKDPGQRFTSAQQFARVLRVQTIPAAPLPNLMAMGETVGGASVLNLSGMTAVTGSSGNMRSGRIDGAGGLLTEHDLQWVNPPRAQPEPPTPAPAPPAPMVVQYAAPPPAGRPWWVVPAGLGVAALAVVVLLAVVFVVFHTRSNRMAVAVPMASSSPTVPLPPPAPTPPTPDPAVSVPTPARPPQHLVPTVSIPPDSTPTNVPTARLAESELTDAEREPLPVTDVDHLMQIGAGTDPARPHRFATIVGKVSRTRPSLNGRTIRIEFAGTKFWVAYWATNKIMSDHMAKRFGPLSADLVGKTIRVTERVTIYDGLPELVLLATDHVKVDGE